MNLETNFENNSLTNQIQNISNEYIKNIILESQRNINILFNNLKETNVKSEKKENKKKKVKKEIKLEKIKYINPKIEKFIP